ncbi:hypothetical protein QYH69_00045 [Paraburkholderia sp. SARCC-3016]|jgi:hypothetical protein|uniref:bestrophin-like domain n=1 Tax=Paraburkholderia sp. SARCC-3016 TaxID=3058611 RepID=UPI002806B8F6|nr:hypothetical protein [Paraburkholderia sp. SARCC-3016]MDQ7975635.1 hypothetical protein [Paraburkholderia sp. SARCC-3016]
MQEITSALVVFVALLIGTAIGWFVKPLLPEEHKAHETVQLIQLVIGMLVTFAALVLGLLTASAKNSFDTVGNDFRAYASDLIRLDQTLREYGKDAEPVRTMLRVYTAEAIASTWPNEPAPPGDYYPKRAFPSTAYNRLESIELGQMLNAANMEARNLRAQDAAQQRALNQILSQFDRLVAARWKLLEEAHSSLSRPFLTTLGFWLFVIFLSFGLIAPRNALALVMISLGAVSIASAMYVIVDLDTPLTGPLTTSSQPMRDALSHLDR